MFTSTFYPTPRPLISKMVGGLNFDSDSYILEPSAGKGDILDYIANQYRPHSKPNLYAIEINPDLRSILEGKGYTLTHDDFLTFAPRLSYTHIIMNPPFDRAEDHILKAWSVLRSGLIISLLPKTSLEGKTLKEQTLARLIEDHGEWEDVGQPFRHAERPTDVEVVIVRLTKQADRDPLEFDVENDGARPTWNEDAPNQELAVNGFANNLLANFSAAMLAFEEYNTARQKLLRYASVFEHTRPGPLDAADEESRLAQRYNTFASNITAQAWELILDHPKFQRMLTERARNMIRDFRQRQKRVDFNEANIKAMFEQLILKQDEILTGAILDAFDTMTKYYKENRVHVEGWKSNECWMVSKKVVLPHFVDEWGGARTWSRPHINYHHRDALTDIDRALCVVSQLPFESVCTVERALNNAFEMYGQQPGWAESTFFEARYFKKGTLHLKFKNEALWKEFNLKAAQGRGWLKPGQ